MFTRCYNCPFHCRHHPFFRELYMQCLIFLKRSQSIPLALQCISSFFFLTCYVELCVDWIFLARVPVTSSFFRGLDGSDISVLSTLWLKICFFEIPEDVVYVVAEVEVATLTCNCSDIIFFKRYSLTRAASFFLNASYFFGSIYFLLSLSVFFSCGINCFTQITLLMSISSTVIFAFLFFYHFQQLLVNALLVNLLTNY